MSNLPSIDCALRDAQAKATGDELAVTTGKLTRAWRWTGGGFSTCRATTDGGVVDWSDHSGDCDWQLPDGTEPANAELRSLSADVGDDEGFTAEHICVTAEIAYPDQGLLLRFSVWAYPGVPGIRTHIAAKLTAALDVQAQPNHQGGPGDVRADRLPIGDTTARRRVFGYYNATQVRNDTHLNILKEETIDHPLIGREWCTWASAACVETSAGGIALVKESHKCVNQNGYATGEFAFDEHAGLISTGLGIRSGDLSEGGFTPGWATWCIGWAGGDLEREVAFKTFDRARYPIDPPRDVYVQANTWGSTPSGEAARLAATEKYVLPEIESCAEMGIDVLQIDDGWQTPPGASSWQPGDNGWRPHPDSYPEGWQNIRARANQLGVKLGLWAAAMPVGLDELKDTYTDGGFVQYKLDFAVLRTREEIDALMNKVRAFIKWTDHRVRVNWDVTENPARYGYFFAREYGCIYLENRKPERPMGVIYRPHTVLRDLWQVSKYLNLHRFQCSIQNVDRVDPSLSDAHLHSHAYSTAIALMGIPLFFQQTVLYSKQAKAEIKAVLDVYKQHRDAIYAGVVHPIGNRPNNASWTGFQSHAVEARRGYLTIFRERCNAEPTGSVKLGWVGGRRVAFTNLMTGEKTEAEVADDGTVSLTIDEAPGFAFCRYDLVLPL